MKVIKSILLAITFMTMPVYAIYAPVDIPKNICDISVEKCIYKYFPEQPKIALAIAKAESNLNTNAIGINYNSVDCGLLQINIKGTKCNDGLFNPEINIKIARKMYEERGWTPWVVYNTKKYIYYLQ